VPARGAAVADRSGTMTMQLGAFSISLTVKGIATSRAFYQGLGFTVSGGDQALHCRS